MPSVILFQLPDMGGNVAFLQAVALDPALSTNLMKMKSVQLLQNINNIWILGSLHPPWKSLPVAKAFSRVFTLCCEGCELIPLCGFWLVILVVGIQVIIHCVTAFAVNRTSEDNFQGSRFSTRPSMHDLLKSNQASNPPSKCHT